MKKIYIQKLLAKKINFQKGIILLSFLVLSSCSHFLKNKKSFSISHNEIPSNVAYEHLEDKYQSSYGEVALDSHPDVKKWLDYFTGRGKDYMRTYLERSSRYIPLMKSVLKESGLPLNLVYVALIESGFSPKALSRSNAVGYWQFIYGTGKRYGLRIDGYVDERKDPVLSTRAAANYFKDLYSLFGSWHLALAAYNSGEFRVNRAVLRHYNRDFWFLSSKKSLPRETRNYIPKFIAAVLISQNPRKYGFYNLQYQEPINYELISVKKPISLIKLSKQMELPIEDMKKLNPIYKGEYVPVYEKETLIRVPVGLKNLAQIALDNSRMKRPKHMYHYHYWYKVRRGDSLYKIARRHKTTIRRIQRTNNMGRRSLLRVGQRLKIPTKRLVASKASSSRKNRKPAKANGSFHTVRRGESLSSIARHYGLALANFKKLNNISGNPVIHPGQKMRIKSAPKTDEVSKHHIVRKGDTLIDIAGKYKVDLHKLMKANNIKTLTFVLLTGTRLIIPK